LERAAGLAGRLESARQESPLAGDRTALPRGFLGFAKRNFTLPAEPVEQSETIPPNHSCTTGCS